MLVSLNICCLQDEDFEEDEEDGESLENDDSGSPGDDSEEEEEEEVRPPKKVPAQAGIPRTLRLQLSTLCACIHLKLLKFS